MANIETRVDINILDSMNNYLIIQDYDESGILILAYNFELDIDKLPSNRDITIFAYNLSQSKSFSLDCKNLFLLSRNYIIENSPTITTSSDGKPFSGAPKQNGSACSSVLVNPIASSGNNFNTVTNIQEDATPNTLMNGTKGGNIYVNINSIVGDIKLSSKGGNGGKGQRGSDGANGCDFPDKDLDESFDGIYRYSAESGGLGALGGLGGDGGNMILVFPESHAINSLTIDISAGNQGDTGDIGNPGLYGGFGYKVKSLHKYDHRGEPIIGHSPIPRTGPGVIIPNPPNNNERKGKDGSVSYKTFDENYSKYIPFEFANLLMLKAESLYLNNYGVNLNECIEILQFINQIADANAGSGFSEIEVKSYLAIYLHNYVTDTEQWKAIKTKAIIYLTQIDLGLDIFGNPANYAPNLTEGYLRTQYNQLSGLLSGFEEFVSDITKKQETIQIDEENRTNSISQYNTIIADYNSDIEKYSRLIISLYSEIEQRFSTIESLKNHLLIDDEDFKKALREETSGCELVTVVHFVTAAIAIASAVYTVGATSAAAIGSVGTIVSSLETVDSFEALQTVLESEAIISSINDIRKDFTTAKDSIDEMKNAYSSLKEPEKSIPGSLIGIDKDNFDKTIDKFLNLPVAQKYKKDFHDFIDHVDLTNQKRKDLTSYVLILSTVYQNLQIAINQQNVLKSDVAKLISKRISFAAKQSITNLYYQTKWSIIKQIYLQEKAIQYQNPQNRITSRNYDDYNIKTLQADIFNANVRFIDSIGSHHYQYGSNANPYTITFNSTDINFKEFLSGKIGTDGQKSYVFEFNINSPLFDDTDQNSKDRVSYLRSIFTNIKNIKVMGIKGILNCNQDFDKSLIFSITHLGNSTITTEENFQSHHLFSHEKLTANPLSATLKQNSVFTGFTESEETNLVGKEFGTQNECFLGVSPFASWRLEISASENPGLDINNVLSNLRNIDLYFWYYYENIN